MGTSTFENANNWIWTSGRIYRHRQTLCFGHLLLTCRFLFLHIEPLQTSRRRCISNKAISSSDLIHFGKQKTNKVKALKHPPGWFALLVRWSCFECLWRKASKIWWEVGVERMAGTLRSTYDFWSDNWLVIVLQGVVSTEQDVRLTQSHIKIVEKRGVVGLWLLLD